MPLLSLADLRPGLAAEIKVAVSAADLDAFAELSGDRAPLHTDADFAASRGMAGRVAHGLLLGAYVSRFLGMHLPGDLGILRRVEMDFRNPVVPPDELTIRGEVAQVSEGTGQVTLQVRVTRGDGTLAATARVQSMVRA
jgi:acyl dehydratase